MSWQRILIVDEESGVRSTLKRALARPQREILTASSESEALDLLRSADPHVILMDIRLGGEPALEVLRQMRSAAPRVPVVIMTADGSTKLAIEAIKQGGLDYVQKPVDVSALRSVIRKALHLARLMREEVALGRVGAADATEVLVGRAPCMIEVFKLIGRVARGNTTVLIRGESGTGKELVARAIYQHSTRSDALFLPVNCAAVPESLLESELFGHEKGAFTGATERRIGRLEQADRGTLFLDEIGDLCLPAQAKLLRVLDGQPFKRVGGRESLKPDVRIIAATNRNLESLLATSRFREDLYYRLNTYTVTIPPLRQRREDIPLLAEYFLQHHGRAQGMEGARLAPTAMARLVKRDWPGNVRELEHCLLRALLLSQGQIVLPEHLPPEGQSPAQGGLDMEVDSSPLRALARQDLASAPGHAHQALMEQAESVIIVEALDQTSGNLTQAATLLGLSRPTLREKIARYHIQRDVHVSQQD